MRTVTSLPGRAVEVARQAEMLIPMPAAFLGDLRLQTLLLLESRFQAAEFFIAVQLGIAFLPQRQEVRNLRLGMTNPRQEIAVASTSLDAFRADQAISQPLDGGGHTTNVVLIQLKA
jgi:hypothetical protein